MDYSCPLTFQVEREQAESSPRMMPETGNIRGSFASLFSWIETFHTLDDALKYEDLMEQDFLFDVLHQIDSRPLWTEPVSCAKDSASQVHNFSTLTVQLLTCYMDCLNQAVLLPMIDVSALVNYSADLHGSQQEMRKILLLVLGLVIQSDRKDDFIAVMETLPGEVKEDIMESYKELSAQLVRLDTLDDSTALQRCCSDRLACFKRGSQALREKLYLESVLLSAQTASSTGPDLLKSLRPPEDLVDFHGYQLLLGSANQQAASLAAQLDDRAAEAAQLADRLRQKKEKTKRLKAQLKNLSCSDKATKLKDLQDENERLKESLGNTEELQAEVVSLRQKLAEFEYFKARVQELRSENGQLLDERQQAEQRLAAMRSQAEAAAERLADCQQRCEELAGQRDAAAEKSTATSRRLAAENRQLREALDALGGADAAAAATAAAAASAAGDADGTAGPSLAAELATAARIRDLEAEVDRLRAAVASAAPESSTKSNEDGALLEAAERALEEARRRAERLLAERTAAESMAADVERKLSAILEERAKAETAAAAELAAAREATADSERRAAESERRLQQLLAERAETAAEAAATAAAEAETEVVLQASQELAKHLARLSGNNRTLRLSCDKLKAELERLAGVELEVLKLRSDREADGRLLRRLETENRQLKRALDSNNSAAAAAACLPLTSKSVSETLKSASANSKSASATSKSASTAFKSASANLKPASATSKSASATLKSASATSKSASATSKSASATLKSASATSKPVLVAARNGTRMPAG
ncbi:hypothetical protein BOX15_Mlig021569g1 [Macrostomum lignano]|uniref:HOOK N-terminal domain-containing protein n=1 Tax=Macrostomum lignano TaxID=282301 RepID=A0A267FCU1_9PLAT|nr:hypothetical protein BOX15_Mlig021569g1 [Macrostomum lignano]